MEANDVQNALWAQIGAGIALNESEQPDPQVRSSASNEIYSNGRYGYSVPIGHHRDDSIERHNNRY